VTPPSTSARESGRAGVAMLGTSWQHLHDERRPQRIVKIARDEAGRWLPIRDTHLPAQPNPEQAEPIVDQGSRFSIHIAILDVSPDSISPVLVL
jgi:hypothetical protein